MGRDIAKKILKNIFVDIEPGTIISTKDYVQIMVWRKETMPILKELEKKRYINIRLGRKNITFKVINYIDEEVINCC